MQFLSGTVSFLLSLPTWTQSIIVEVLDPERPAIQNGDVTRADTMSKTRKGTNSMGSRDAWVWVGELHMPKIHLQCRKRVNLGIRAHTRFFLNTAIPFSKYSVFYTGRLCQVHVHHFWSVHNHSEVSNYRYIWGKIYRIFNTSMCMYLCRCTFTNNLGTTYTMYTCYTLNVLGMFYWDFCVMGPCTCHVHVHCVF